MIPKIAHVIWLGEPDSRVEVNIAAFKKYHPDWKIILWVGPPVRFPNRERYERGRYPAAKANVLRIHLLKTMGGLYFDADVVWRAPLPELDPQYLWAAQEVPNFLNNSLMACVPSHPAIVDYEMCASEAIDIYGHMAPSSTSSGPKLLTKLWGWRDDIQPLAVSRNFAEDARILHRCWNTWKDCGVGYDPQQTRSSSHQAKDAP